MNTSFQVIVIGGGHAGVEAAWAAANLLPRAGGGAPPTVALVTLDPATIGVMSCNPAIGGLAKGQIVREIDALHGVMGLAADASGIHFKVLNASKGAAVRGPRAQCDKHLYAETVQRLLAARPEIEIIGAAVERLIVERGEMVGVEIAPLGAARRVLHAGSVVLTTGTFMRGLMHTGEARTAGGRFGEGAATGISGALRELGFELGRLKTGTPPRLKRSTIDWESLEAQWGDIAPTPFSDLSNVCARAGIGAIGARAAALAPGDLLRRFPLLPQVECRITATNEAIHEHIRANLHRAPMYSGQIESIGPRYCPSLEDKVVRFAERSAHHVFLEPESLRDEWVYCNGISTSLPEDVQRFIVQNLPGCGRAEILRLGYAVEYDMVKPHQIRATAETRSVRGLLLAGQINGTSGYEEAGAQGIVAGINGARRALGQDAITIARDRAYIGVLMDDLVTKTPTEPYRMFTSRAEHRLHLRADNAADRLTPLAGELGLLDSTALGALRGRLFARRGAQIAALGAAIDAVKIEHTPLDDVLRRPEFTGADFRAALPPELEADEDARLTVQTDRFYRLYLARAHAALARDRDLERRPIPDDLDAAALAHLRHEARRAVLTFRPATLGQAARLEGLTPSDVTLLEVLIRKHRAAHA